MNPFESGAVIDMNMGHNSATPAPTGAPDTLTTTAPERIWLQIDPAGAPIDYAESFPADAEGVSDFSTEAAVEADTESLINCKGTPSVLRLRKTGRRDRAAGGVGLNELLGRNARKNDGG